jgi:hypothetical protein
MTKARSSADFAAGGFFAGKNKYINPDFGIWQRGTSFTSVANNAYTADRCRYSFDGTGTATISRQTFTEGTAPVAGYEGTFFLRHLVTAAGTTTFAQVFQPVEDVRTFAGQTVTFSFWAKADAARSSFIYAEQFFGAGGSATVQYLSMGSASLTTSWQRFSFTVALSSIAGKTIGTSSCLNFYIRCGTTLNATTDVWGMQLEAGSTATAFQTATGTIQGELAACQRYYYVHASGATVAIGVGYNETGSSMGTHCKYAVTMRTGPSLVVATGTDYYTFYRNGANDNFNTFIQGASGPQEAAIYNNSEISGTAGMAGNCYTNNAAAMVAFNAEL